MSSHTRDRSYNFGTYNDDLKRGLETLEQSTYYAKKLGYKNIWVSREESSKLLEYFSNHSKYNWTLNYEKLHYGGKQYVMRIND